MSRSSESAPGVADPTTVRAVNAARAISADIETIRSSASDTNELSPPTSPETPISDGSGSTPTSAEFDTQQQEWKTWPNLDAPPNVSNEQWPLPVNVRGLAAQANRIATAMLNDQVDLEKAKAYSALVRSVAQMMSIEVTRARFLRAEPILEFEDDTES